MRLTVQHLAGITMKSLSCSHTNRTSFGAQGRDLYTGALITMLFHLLRVIVPFGMSQGPPDYSEIAKGLMLDLSGEKRRHSRSGAKHTPKK
ncbi:MAG: hypothetical protein Hals2KO_36980 [Halioglobus sp.]